MYLNKQNEVGLTTRLRVKEAQLKYMHISNILSNSCKLDYTGLKFNLAYKIIYKGKKLGFSFQESSAYEENLEISGTSISSLLDEKKANRYRESNNMCIFILEQLITGSGDRLLTWQQVRHIRDCKRRGRKPLWFQYIEERVLDCIILRTLKEEYRIVEPNQNAITCSKLKISTDKRKKEWIIFKEKERSFEIGKVIKKEHKHFVTEHWQIEANNDTGNMLARKCNGCTLGRCNDTSCIIRQKQKIWHQVLKRVSCRGTTMSVEIPISAYTESKKLLLEKEEGYRRKVEIRAVSIEEAVIQRVIKNKEIQSKLINIVKKLKRKKELDIYTDGLLVVENGGNREGKKMGIGWIVASNNSNKNSISFKSRIAD